MDVQTVGRAAGHHVGTDDTASEDDYKRVVRVIREGLLANLQPETARKVAYANADRLFGPR